MAKSMKTHIIKYKNYCLHLKVVFSQSTKYNKIGYIVTSVVILYTLRSLPSHI